MNKKRIGRTLLDIFMTGCMIFLSGSGSSSDNSIQLLHEWLGILLMTAVVCHLILNRHWIRAVTKGRYNRKRILMTVTAVVPYLCTLFILAAFAAISAGTMRNKRK